MYHWIWILLGLVACNPTPGAEHSQSREWQSGLDSVEMQSLYLRIDKASYSLEVWLDSVKLHSYPVVFGGNPVDDKFREGDQSTPEGRFTIKAAYPHSEWSYFLWLDYPTADSWAKHNAAKEAGLIPADASIGGEIGIHGVPKGYDHAVDQRQNWTLGCVSLKRADIAELYQLVQLGTVVWIE